MEKVAKVLGSFVHPCPVCKSGSSSVVKPVWQHFFHSYTLLCTTLRIGFIQNIFTCTFKMFWTLMCQSSCSSAYLLQRRGFQQGSWLPSKVPFQQMSPVVPFPDFQLEIWGSRSKSAVQFSVNQLFKFIIHFARNWRNVTSILSTDGYSHARTTHITPKCFSQCMLFRCVCFKAAAHRNYTACAWIPTCHLK